MTTTVSLVRSIGRSRPAATMRLSPNTEKANHKFDLGLALNANRETLFREDYAVNNYKAFQYIWYNTKIGEGMSLSISGTEQRAGLSLTTRKKKKSLTAKTLGPRLTFANGKFSGDLAFYYQTGKVAETDLNASYLGANLMYKLTNELGVKVGTELLSGTDMNTTDNELKSFTPFYGTNHKFNGFMDYFYVGNHINSVGLTDIYGAITYKKNGFSIAAMPHFFSAPGVILDSNGAEMDSNLGTEIDLTFGYKVSKSIALTGGYSKMFATETMEVLKGGSKDEANHWFWLSLNLSPELFSYKKEDTSGTSFCYNLHDLVLTALSSAVSTQLE